MSSLRPGNGSIRWGGLLAGVLLAILLFPLGSWLVFGALGASVLSPLVTRLERLGIRRRVGAAAVTLGLTLTVGIPVVFTASHAVRGVANEFRAWKQAHPEGSPLQDLHWMEGILQRAERVLPFRAEDLQATLEDGLKTALLKGGEKATQAVAQLPGMVTGLVILALSLFFLLADGAAWVAEFRAVSPLGEARTALLLDRLTRLARSVVGASALSGLTQALFFATGMLLVGAPQAPSVALATLLASFIPLVGATPVTVGTAVFFWFTHGSQMGGILAVFALITSVLDNFVRPWVLGSGSARLHPWLAFVSALAGLELFGMTGIFLGPVVAGVALALWEFETVPS